MRTAVLTRPFMEDGFDALREVCSIQTRASTSPPDEEALAVLVHDATALVATAGDPVTDRVLAAGSGLRIVAQFGVGVDNIDLEAALQRGIVVTNTPGAVTDSTADLAFALLLAVARKVPRSDQAVRSGSFSATGMGMELRGKVLGIIGLGRIGAAVGRRAIGFGMKVVYYNRNRANPTFERESGSCRLPLAEVLAHSDVVSVHCALNADSYHMLDETVLRTMKPGAVLINTARGAIVDEAALARVLREGHLAGAGLDVFEAEPQVHPELLSQPRAVLLPHVGSRTREAREAMACMVTESILTCLQNARRIPYRVV